MPISNIKKFVPRNVLRFSLRTLLIIITLFAIWFSVQIKRAKDQKTAVEAVAKLGGWVYYDYEHDGVKNIKGAKSRIPDWIINQVGIDLFHNVVVVNMVMNDDGPKRLDNSLHIDEVKNYLLSFPKLTHLYLCDTQATDDLLEKVGRLSHLELIMMWDATNVTDQGAAHLKNISTLKYIHLSVSKITDESLRHFGEMYQLTGLALQGNKFTDVGLSYLKDLKNIETLWVDLYANGKQGLLTDQGIKHLEGLTKLKELGVQQMPNITPEGIQRLQTAIPNLKSVSK